MVQPWVHKKNLSDRRSGVTWVRHLAFICATDQREDQIQTNRLVCKGEGSGFLTNQIAFKTHPCSSFNDQIISISRIHGPVFSIAEIWILSSVMLNLKKFSVMNSGAVSRFKSTVLLKTLPALTSPLNTICYLWLWHFAMWRLLFWFVFILRYSIEANRLLKIPVDYSELINEASLFT